MKSTSNTVAEWKARAEAKEKRRRNSRHERHMQALAMVDQIKRELRAERKAKAS